jgi:hypothetical protein
MKECGQSGLWGELKGVTVNAGTHILAVTGVSRLEVNCSKLEVLLLQLPKKKRTP